MTQLKEEQTTGMDERRRSHILKGVELEAAQSLDSIIQVASAVKLHLKNRSKHPNSLDTFRGVITDMLSSEWYNDLY